MEKNPDQMVTRETAKAAKKGSNDVGEDKVTNSNGMYAYFMESTIIEYKAERNCHIIQVGKLLNNKGYGIATRKGYQ